VRSLRFSAVNSLYINTSIQLPPDICRKGLYHAKNSFGEQKENKSPVVEKSCAFRPTFSRNRRQPIAN
jgi:hypothetical protein